MRTTFASSRSSAGDLGLVDEDVEPCADPARTRARDERVLVDDLAARGVHEAGAVAQQREPARVDQTVASRSQRHVDA